MGLIAQRVAAARAGTDPQVVTRVPSGWVLLGDAQVLRGYCLLLADPVVSSLNDLVGPARSRYLDDMGRVGDAILRVTGAKRINYEILGNLEPELHAHVFPRYADEPDDKRRLPVWFYDWKRAEPFDEAMHGALRDELRRVLESAL